QHVNYDIKIENQQTGLGTAYNVTVEEKIPTFLNCTSFLDINTLINATNNKSEGLTNETYYWNIGNLTPAETKILMLNCTVSAPKNGTENFTNTAYIKFEYGDGANDLKYTNNQTISVLGLSNITVNKSIQVTVSIYQPGHGIVFIINVTNTGNIALHNIDVRDELDSVSVYNVTLDGQQVNYDIYNNVLNLTISNLNPGDSAIIKIYANISDNATNGTHTNFVSVSANSTTGLILANSSVNYVVGIPSLTISKQAPSLASFGEEISYTINVTNNGTYTIENLKVWDEIPEGLRNFSNFTSVNSSCIGQSCNIYPNLMRFYCDVFNLSNGSSCIITAKLQIYDINESREGEYTNYVYANAQNFNEYKEINASALTKVKKPWTRAEKYVFSIGNKMGEVYQGEEVTFIINITNKDIHDMCNVTVTDNNLISSGFENTSPTTKDIGNLSINESKIVNFTFKAPTAKMGNYINKVEADMKDCATGKQKQTSDMANITVLLKLVEVKVDLEVTKTANVSSVYKGDQVEFNITVKNLGPEKAWNVSVNDTLPNGWKLIDGNLSSYIEYIEVNDTKNITIIAEVTNDAPFGDSTNYAIAKGHEDSANGTERQNSGLVVVEVKQRPKPNLVINKIADKQIVVINDTITFTITVFNNGTG
ncbi:MAG: DUF11 domain-containing protein, partial [Candidatus Altiarchaeum hamiconexum]|nr:DUF11 domain-containing protein [Candidatus Altarchaeum hamiconexum]NCT01529.1 DUF11 domain-containing protein [Candidatus Altarchaeum hamiconexum]